MKKILMVNPPVSIYINKTAFIPLPLLVLGTCLGEIREDGLEFSHEILDLDLLLKTGRLSDDASFYQESGDLILGKSPDILMFTVHGLNHVVVLKLAKRIKAERPSCRIIVGGVGPTLQASRALKRCADIDIIVKGEGEVALKHLIPAILNQGDVSGVPSIVYRDGGQICETPRQYLGEDEPIPYPDYSLVNVEDYITHNRTNPYIHPGFSLIESGRGCPNRCSFCAPAKMWESNIRYRPVPEIIKEMRFLAEKGGDFSFFTQDNLEEKFLRELSEALIQDKIDIPWGCYSRLDRIPDDLAPLLSKAGCQLIFTGFETPNRNVQKTIRKIVDVETTFGKLQHFNALGIQLIGSFIAGFKDETDEDIDHTMRFAIECATGLTFEALDGLITRTDNDKLPQRGANMCAIHPLVYMPGTDTFSEEEENLHLAKYALHPDCYGSYLFSYDEFKDDWSFLGGNPYLNHFSEDKVRFYCAILRLFNLLNSRPYYFALLLSTRGVTPLALMKEMVVHLGEEFVLTEEIREFEKRCRDFVKLHLDFAPEWTVKKGQ